MGARGPAPKPTALKRLEGNPGKRALATGELEPRVPAKAPAPPAFLDEVATKEWKRVAPELHRLGLLTVVDIMALAAYCQCYSDYLTAREAIARAGGNPTFTTDKGYVGQRPEVTIAQKSLALMKAYMAEFGMTPSARARMALPQEPTEQDPLDEFLARKNRKGNE